MSLNTAYIIVFENHRDVRQISTLPRRMKPNNTAYIINAFIYATRLLYTYLVLY